uniref:Si:dkey-217d24.6 n=1 Tax=Tetraodon nigroviridis TaxID=99883 RepID=H3D3D1_TETNG
CEVCGTYFESRRGLSSHARLHLRQLGVALSESSGAPISLLYQLVRERDGCLPEFKADSSADGSALLRNTTQQDSRKIPEPEDPTRSSPQTKSYTESPTRPKETTHSLLPSSPSCSTLVESRASEGSSSSCAENQTATKPLWAPLETDAPIRLVKRPKTSADCTCVLCGEEFESRKGLASHSRSHLNQLGVVDLLGKSSPIQTIQELVSSGMLGSLHPPKADSSAASPSPAPGPFSSLTSFPSTTLSTSPGKGSSQPCVARAPKAKKGFRLAVDPLQKRPKLEPVETEVSAPASGPTADGSPGSRKPAAAAAALKPPEADVQSPPTVLCDYCGQLFDTRKALSCHARAHLRHLGLVWSIRTSPIDLLKEVMIHGVESVKESAGSGSAAKAAPSPQGSRKSADSLHLGEADSKSCTSPLNYSLKEKSPSVKSGTPHPGETNSDCSFPTITLTFDREFAPPQTHYLTFVSLSSSLRSSRVFHISSDASCELCGFEFENRKALASHARAHLRQLGIIEWKADGATSPIELLSELIRKDPVKVEAITRRYRMGDLYIKKSHRSAASPSVSRDPDFESSLKPSAQHREDAAWPPARPGSRRATRAPPPPTATPGSVPPEVRDSTGRHVFSLSSARVEMASRIYPPKHVTAARERSQDSSRQPARSGSIPALLPKPPLTPLVKLVGKVYSLKCRFCDEVFEGPLSIQARWIAHLQKHILTLGYKGKESPPAAPVPAPALVPP